MIYDHPIAVLVGLHGYERIVPLRSVPPPPQIEIPIREPWNLCASPDDVPRYQPIRRRTFKLCEFSSQSEQWWEVYNEGRSQTPQNGFVYFEVPASPPEER